MCMCICSPLEEVLAVNLHNVLHIWQHLPHLREMWELEAVYLCGWDGRRVWIQATETGMLTIFLRHCANLSKEPNCSTLHFLNLGVDAYLPISVRTKWGMIHTELIWLLILGHPHCLVSTASCLFLFSTYHGPHWPLHTLALDLL